MFNGWASTNNDSIKMRFVCVNGVAWVDFYFLQLSKVIIICRGMDIQKKKNMVFNGLIQISSEWLLFFVPPAAFQCVGFRAFY